MEENIKVRVTNYYHDQKLNKFFTSGTIRYLNHQRTRELLKLGVIAIMEIRKCKYE